MLTIDIPDELAKALESESARKGITVQALVVETLTRTIRPQSTSTKPRRTLFEALGDAIGSVEGTSEHLSQDCGKHFTDGLVEKHEAIRRRYLNPDS